MGCCSVSSCSRDGHHHDADTHPPISYGRTVSLNTRPPTRPLARLAKAHPKPSPACRPRVDVRVHTRASAHVSASGLVGPGDALPPSARLASPRLAIQARQHDERSGRHEAHDGLCGPPGLCALRVHRRAAGGAMPRVFVPEWEGPLSRFHTSVSNVLRTIPGAEVLPAGSRVVLGVDEVLVEG